MPSTPEERAARRERMRLANQNRPKSPWEWANAPVFEQPSQFGRWLANDVIDPPMERKLYDPVYLPGGIPVNVSGAKSFLAGATEGAGDVLSSLTSPLNLAMSAATFGAGGLARAGFGAASSALTNTARAGGAAMMAHGAHSIYDAATRKRHPEDKWRDVATGVMEMGGGYVGLKTPYPQVKAPLPTPPPRVQQRALPPGNPAAPISDIPGGPTPRFYSGVAGTADATVPNRTLTRSGGFPDPTYQSGTPTPGEIGEVIDLPPQIAAMDSVRRQSAAPTVYGPVGADPNVPLTFEQKLAQARRAGAGASPEAQAVKKAGKVPKKSKLPKGPLPPKEPPVVEGPLAPVAAIEDPTRPLAKTSDKDLQGLIRLGSKMAKDELALRTAQTAPKLGAVDDLTPEPPHPPDDFHIDEVVTPEDMHPDPDNLAPRREDMMSRQIDDLLEEIRKSKEQESPVDPNWRTKTEEGLPEGLKSKTTREAQKLEPVEDVGQKAPNTTSLAFRWRQSVDELDRAGAPDTAYRDIMSTGGKDALKKGETWRSRVLKYIEMDRQRQMETPQEAPRSSLTERLKDETGAVGDVEGVRRTRRLTQALGEWRRKAFRNDEGTSGEGGMWTKPADKPTLEDFQATYDEFVEQGNDPEEVMTAIRDASRRGINPRLSETLEDLSDYVKDTTDVTDRFRPVTPQKSTFGARLKKLRDDEIGAVGDVEGIRRSKLGEVDDIGQPAESMKDRLKRLAVEEEARTPRQAKKFGGSEPPADRPPVSESADFEVEKGGGGGGRKPPKNPAKILEGFSKKNQKHPIMRAYADWVNWRRASKAEGSIKRREFKDLDEKGMDGILEFQKGNRSGRYKDVQDYFDAKHAEAVEHGIRLGFKENYLPQLWDNSADEVFQAQKKLGLNPKFSMESVIENYQKGIDYGLKPKHKNISELIGWYEQTANKAIADRKFYDFLKSEGLLKPKGKAPSDGSWATLDPDHFPVQKFQTKKGEEIPQTLSAPKHVADLVNNYLRSPNEVIQWFADKASLAKNFAMSSGIPKTAVSAHGTNSLVRNMMGRGLGKGGKEGLEFMLNPESAAKYLDENIEKAPFFIKHGFTMSTEGFELEENMIKELTKGVIPENYKFPAVGKAMNHLDKAAAKLLSKHDELFEKPLFQKMIPALKLQHVQTLYDDFLKSGLDKEEAAREASRLVNDLYGGINWEAMGRSRGWQNALRAMVLAPDWAETNINLGKGMIQSLKKGQGNTPTGKVSATVAKNMMGIYLAGNVANYATTGHGMWDNPPGHAMDIAIGKSGDKYRYLRPFGTAADFARIPVETIAAGKQGDLGQGLRVVKNRLSLPASSVGSLLWNQDDFGRPIFGKDKFGKMQPIQTQMGNFIGEVSDVVVPPYASNAFKLVTGKQNLEQAILSSAEMPVRYAQGKKSKRRGKPSPPRPSR